MTQMWPVLPLMEGISDWFRREGLTVPDTLSRYPSLSELLDVLRALNYSPIKTEIIPQSADHVARWGVLWRIVVGEYDSPAYATFLGSDKNGEFSFSFDHGSYSKTVIEILKKLAGFCGPLVVIDTFAATPLVVFENTVIDSALADWQKRIDAAHNADEQKRLNAARSSDSEGG
jgi:hypothetical protein